MTPREFAAALEGQRRRETRDFTIIVTGHYYGASFARAKKMPDLERLLRRITGREKPVEQKSPEQLLAIIEKWNKALGGEDHTTPEPEED